MTIEVLEEVRNVVADYLTARKVYPTYEQAIEAYQDGELGEFFISLDEDNEETYGI